jgi:hypothetical protein
MAYCANCGSENEPDAVFCSSCGAPLEGEPPPPPPPASAPPAGRGPRWALVGGVAALIVIVVGAVAVYTQVGGDGEEDVVGSTPTKTSIRTDTPSGTKRPTEVETATRAAATPKPTAAEGTATPAGSTTPACGSPGATSEEAVGSCFKKGYDGDCDGGGVRCSVLLDSLPTERLYGARSPGLSDDPSLDLFDLLVDQTPDGRWYVKEYRQCGTDDFTRCYGLSLGSFGLEKWSGLTKADNNGRAVLTAGPLTFSDARGLRVYVTFQNVSGGTLPWTSDVGNPEIYLTDPAGAAYNLTSVGGRFAEDITTGFPAGSTWRGWLVFDAPDLGEFVLHYPNHNPIAMAVEWENPG